MISPEEKKTMAHDRLFKEVKDVWESSVDPSKSPLRNNFALCPLVISNCNGTGDWDFTDATLEYAQLEGCTLGYWFHNAVNLVTAELSHRSSACMNQLQEKAFDHLLKFVNEIDKHKDCLSFMCKSRCITESEVCGILALHLFAPLVNGDYKIEGFPGKSEKCCKCQETLEAGDTSFGNKGVWHGTADIMVKNSIVQVYLKKEEDEFDQTEKEEDECNKTSLDKDTAMGDSFGQMSLQDRKKVRECPGLDRQLTDNGHDGRSDIFEDKLVNSSQKKISSQVLAQTIVNSFCCVNVNKSLSNMFIPSFLVSESEVSIHMYNCEQDKLLTSAPLPLWRKGDLDDYTLNINTILYVWIALHFDLFDTKTSNSLQEYFPCSRFKVIVGSKYEIYKEKMVISLVSCDDNKVLVTANQFLVDPTIQIDDSTIKKSKKMSEDLIVVFESTID